MVIRLVFSLSVVFVANVDTYNKACDLGLYGISCNETCRCVNPARCDKITGECTDRACIIGWKGRYCNISTLVSQGKPVRMSSQHDNWVASRSVDGNIRRDAHNCQCCAATLLTDYPWLEVNLTIPHRISYIIIYGRDDYNFLAQRFTGLRIIASKAEIWATPIKGNVSFLNITLDHPVITRYITLKQVKSRLLVICEVQIFEGVCPNGTFGPLCDKACHCLGQPCDEITGECPSAACEPGYHGDTCSEECDVGYYGSGCTKTCGFCFNDTVCEHVQGNCTSCEPGYRGHQCKEKCESGSYGLNCTTDCGPCKTGEACDHVTGHCINGCHPGYIGTLCNMTCQFGTFGFNCSGLCGRCANNRTCNHTTGHCGDECIEGYIPPLCVSSAQKQTKDDDILSSGVLTAIIVCLALFILLLVVVTVVVFRRRSRNQNMDNRACDVSGATVNFTKAVAKQKTRTDTDKLSTKKKVEFSTDAPGDIEYYECAQNDIKIHQLWDYVHRGMENECSMFNSEFQSLKSGLQNECKAALTAVNMNKNMYKGVYAYDETRVKLTPSTKQTNGVGESDYINASFVDGFEMKAKFIASQGPTKSTVDDFWRMVFEQDCSVIVMLTNIIEYSLYKSFQYWPAGEEPVTFGLINVKLLMEDKFTDYVVRHLEVNAYDDSRRVIQYHLTSWSDKNVPDTTWSLVNFWRAVTAECKNVTTPIVVHCSAGIGRTGTFIALDNLYNQARTKGFIRPVEMIESLRKQRLDMVQTKEQYRYLHEAVAEALLFGTRYINLEQFEDVYYYLTQAEEGETISNMEKQFNLIEMSLENPVYCEIDSILDDSTTVICERKVEEESTYMNVAESDQSDAYETYQIEPATLPYTYLRDNKDELSYVLHQEVNHGKETFKDMLSVIITSGAETVIHLKDNSEDVFLVTDDSTTKDCQVKQLQAHGTDEWSQKDFQLKFNKTKSGTKVMRNVRVFEFADWKVSDNRPSSDQTFLDFVTEILIWQPQITNEKPILIIYSEGVRQGAFCAVLNEMTRIKHDGKVNMVESVRKIRLQNKALLPNFEQYQLCYDVIRLLLQKQQSEKIYKNV